MRITRWGEYGMHFAAMIALEEQNGHVPVGAERISQAQGVDINYTQQILQRLRKNNIVNSLRGPQGGYKLARPASEITLLDVLVAAEGASFEIICDHKPIDHKRCNGQANCALSQLWRDLKTHIDAFLANTTLHQFAQNFIEEHNSFMSRTSLDKPKTNQSTL